MLGHRPKLLLSLALGLGAIATALSGVLFVFGPTPEAAPSLSYRLAVGHFGNQPGSSQIACGSARLDQQTQLTGWPLYYTQADGVPDAAGCSTTGTNYLSIVNLLIDWLLLSASALALLLLVQLAHTKLRTVGPGLRK